METQKNRKSTSNTFFEYVEGLCVLTMNECVWKGHQQQSESASHIHDGFNSIIIITMPHTHTHKTTKNCIPHTAHSIGQHSFVSLLKTNSQHHTHAAVNKLLE